MNIKNKMLALFCVITMIFSFALSSCAEEPTVPKKEPSSDDTPKDEWINIPESYCIKLEEVVINLGGEYDSVITLATLYVGTDDSGELFGEGEGTLVSGDTEDKTESTVKASFDGDGGYILTLSGDEKRLLAVTREEILEGINAAIGFDLEAGVNLLITSPLELISWVENDLFLALGQINYSSIMGDISKGSDKLLEGIVTKTKVGSEYSCEVSLPALYELLVKLNSHTAKEIYEIAFGEGSFREFKTAVAGSLTLSISELVEKLESTGARRDKLFAALDSLAAIISDDEGATIEGVLGIEGDLEEKLSAEGELYTVSDLLMEVTGASGPTELSFKLEDFYKLLGNKNVFELLGGEDIAEQAVALLLASREGVRFTYTERGSGAKTNYRIYGNMTPFALFEKEYGGMSLDLSYKINGEISASVSLENGGTISLDAQLISNYRDENIGKIRAEIDQILAEEYPELKNVEKDN